MSNSYLRATLIATLAVSLAACGASTPSASPALDGATNRVSGAATPNVSGEYAGMKGSVHASFAQNRTSVGGTYTESSGSQTTSYAVEWNLSKGTTLTGISAATVDGAACTFKLDGMYSTTNYEITGSYQPLHGCKGDSGSFTIKQKCTYPPGEYARPQNGPKPC